MTQKYTANEITEMRVYCNEILSKGCANYREFESNATVEEALRTYIMAGVSPMDLKSVADKKIQDREEDYAKQRELQYKIRQKENQDDHN